MSENRYLEFLYEAGGAASSFNTSFFIMTALELSSPKPITSYINIPGSSIPIDLSTVLTNGQPTFEQRNLLATFESGEATRTIRRNNYLNIFNSAHGQKLKIKLPDFENSTYYLLGRSNVELLEDNVNYLRFQITSICDPWIYTPIKTVSFEVEETVKKVSIDNPGKMSVVPIIEVVGGPVNITYYDVDPLSLIRIKTYSHNLNSGTYKFPTLIVNHPGRYVEISGSGTIKFKYQIGELLL
ncbi:MAG: hypothetical protein ACI4II_05360 [Acutalibacteraceae bacterium]